MSFNDPTFEEKEFKRIQKDLTNYEGDKDAYMGGKRALSRDENPYEENSRGDCMFNMGVSSQELSQEHFLNNRW